MENTQKSVVVYHATPLCGKCKDEILKVEKASAREGARTRVAFSLWKRLKFGLQLVSMPVVVVDNRPFSVLGAFEEEALAAVLRAKKSYDVTR